MLTQFEKSDHSHSQVELYYISLGAQVVEKRIKQMDFILPGLVLLLMVWAWFHVLRSNLLRRGQLPPGPCPFPIIGNILKLGKSPHQSLANLSKTYGPLMSLQLGSTYTVVVSSPEMAKQVLHEYDLIFSGRAIPAAMQVHNHDKFSVAYLPVGNKWRELRKICREKMFSSQRLDASQGLRREKLQKLRDYVHRCCLSGRAVNISEAAFVTSLNLMTATLFSFDFTNFGSDSTQEFKECIETLGKVAGSPNLADFFPVLKWVDPQGIKREAEFNVGKMLALIGEILDKRLEWRATSSNGSRQKSDLLEALLDLKEGSEYQLSFEGIKHLLLDLFAAGTESTSVAVEWAMTELLLNPEKMASTQNELRSVVGEKELVEESDMSKLPYLQAVIKETLRYHPPGPFLVPRKAEDEAKINGYTIPKGTQILINVWAIGRDPSVWANPNLLEPERFLNKEIDFKGRDFTLIPFGSGRRICPGLPLADRMLHLMVANLIHKFEWRLEAGVKEIDTAEKFGLGLRKAVPLEAVPTKV